ncbi:MAG: RAD55 family ATPase [Salinirussus sp.]
MYDLGTEFENAEVEPGTNVLVSGPPLTGKRRLALGVLAAGAANDEGSVIVTTRDSADRVIADYRTLVDDIEETDLGIVDCVTQHQGSSPEDTPRVKYASSPVDMTGIGIKFSEFVETFYTNRGIQRNRIALDSLSTLLMYADLQTVFRFMHVFTSRIEDADALGIHVIESTAHGPEEMNTLKQLFDGVVEVGEDSELSVRLPGIGDGSDAGAVGP